MLQGLAVGGSAAPKPHSDATGQNALSDALVEGAHDGCQALALFKRKLKRVNYF